MMPLPSPPGVGIRSPYDVLLESPLFPSITARDTALVIIDMQRLDAHREYGFGRKLADAGRAELGEPFFARLDRTVVPNICSVLTWARVLTGMTIVHVRIAVDEENRSEVRRHYRHWGMAPLVDSVEASFLAEVEPQPGEAVINKVGTSAFTNPALLRILRERGTRQLLVCGVNTNNCVEMTARSAVDESFFVTVIGDACASIGGMAVHDAALRRLDFGFSRVRSAEEITHVEP